ncbi:hypothetical protein [Streptomyces sp. CC224B]|uniref:hypothetical protein n=1 Tax=Streptomyces sp. CC224B TaxID=3044571 RepID=UPI0024A7B479|nr:hypothetical protein [Streptomyces sp. CC224B]
MRRNLPAPDWAATSPALTSVETTRIAIHGRITHQIATAHDIQLGLAPLLILPMLYDLAATGLWERHRSGRLRLTDRDCHVFTFNHEGTAVKEYAASHPDHRCPRPPQPDERERRAWLPHFVDDHKTLPPPEYPRDGWRLILRRAATLPLTVLPPALAFYARYHYKINTLAPTTVARVFHSFADTAPTVYDRWQNTPGHHLVEDPAGLFWSLSRTMSNSAKPAVTGIYPPRGMPADHPADQRANRAPGSSTLATRHRPTHRP